MSLPPRGWSGKPTAEYHGVKGQPAIKGSLGSRQHLASKLAWTPGMDPPHQHLLHWLRL